MHYLTSCSMVKQENPYIKDFVKIHRYLGVEHFLFFDREQNNLSEIFKHDKDIEVIYFPETPMTRHAHAWRDGVIHLTGKSKWVQFIDIDQVVVPKQVTDIKVMLQNYEKYASLGLNWHTFGNSGRETEPEEGISTYEAYTMRAVDQTPINNHIQSIVQPDRVEQVIWNDPHHPTVKKGETQINSILSPFKGPFNVPPFQDIGFIAHYYTRSKQYWANKIAKMRADTGTAVGTMADFEHHQTYLNAVEDLTIKEIWNKAKCY